MKKNSEINVALILGGTSPEREVSKSSAQSILKALQNLEYNVKLIDPAYGSDQPPDHEPFFSDDDYADLNNRNYVDAINSSLFDGIDVAFLALHGKWGEDGVIQSMLEMRGIKYTGSGVLPSALSMDKSMAKIHFHHYHVNTPRWFVVQKNDDDFNLIKERINTFFGYPCVIKPNDQGSTVGLSICQSGDEVEEAVDTGRNYSDLILIEEYIPGHEITVGILENHALPVLEIKPKHSYYDYECKYTHGMSEYEVPANFPPEVLHHVQQQSLLAFNSLGCTNYGRVDLRMTHDHKVYCLEVNTLPGMTSTSLVPKMAKAVGISFEELVDKILKLAL